MDNTFLILENDSLTAMAISRSIVNKSNKIVVKRSLIEAESFIDANYIDCIIANENILYELSIMEELEETLIRRGVPILFLSTADNLFFADGLNVFAVVEKPFHPEEISELVKSVPLRQFAYRSHYKLV